MYLDHELYGATDRPTSNLQHPYYRLTKLYQLMHGSFLFYFIVYKIGLGLDRTRAE